MDPCLIYESDHYRVEHARDCRIRGYLIVTPKVPVRKLSAMSAAALRDLGATLARASQALEDLLEPARTYCARFGEGSEEIHFHIFPRTARLLDLYRREHPETGETCSGPLLLDWARKRYRVTNPEGPLTPECAQVVQSLRKVLIGHD
jgi:diadenosine tetraphosphate (Ap4A) HIT family hydrolase